MAGAMAPPGERHEQGPAQRAQRGHGRRTLQETSLEGRPHGRPLLAVAKEVEAESACPTIAHCLCCAYPAGCPRSLLLVKQSRRFSTLTFIPLVSVKPAGQQCVCVCCLADSPCITASCGSQTPFRFRPLDGPYGSSEIVCTPHTRASAAN